MAAASTTAPVDAGSSRLAAPADGEETKLDLGVEKAAGEEAPTTLPLHLVLGASIAGSVLEWFDFAVFGFFAKAIGKNFFPLADSRTQIIKAFSVYAGGFLVRPIGSLIFGYVGDTWGTARALQVSIFAMALPTFCVGLLPVYKQIGLAAPALLTALRVLQGLCVGGELVGSVLYAVENTPARQTGLYGGLMLGMALVGIFMGSALASVMNHFLTKAQLLKWGWRVPFLLGLLVGGIGFFIRSRSMAASGGHHVRRARPAGMSSMQAVAAVFKSHWLEVLEGAGIASLYHAGFYLCCVWMGTYISELATHPIKGDLAFGISSWGLAVHIAALPLFGALADNIGRAKVMAAGGVGLGAAAPFVFALLLDRGEVWLSVAGVTILSLLVAMWGGPLFSWIIHNNSSSAPMTAVGLAYNLAAAAFGGTAAVIGTALCSSHFPYAPGLYLTGVACLSTATLLGTHMVKDRPQDLDYQGAVLEEKAAAAAPAVAVAVRELELTADGAQH